MCIFEISSLPLVYLFVCFFLVKIKTFYGLPFTVRVLAKMSEKPLATGKIELEQMFLNGKFLLKLRKKNCCMISLLFTGILNFDLLWPPSEMMVSWWKWTQSRKESVLFWSRTPLEMNISIKCHYMVRIRYSSSSSSSFSVFFFGYYCCQTRTQL